MRVRGKGRKERQVPYGSEGGRSAGRMARRARNIKRRRAVPESPRQATH